MLVLEGVSKNFGKTRALVDVSLTIGPGVFVSIIGPSGAGKSTLLRTINRLVEPDRGTVQFQGRNIIALRGADLRAWRAKAAMIFQQFNLIPRLDVVTNVLLGRLAHRPVWRTLLKDFSVEERALAITVLDRLGMAAAAFQRAETLSGGQQQRVAIARALLQEPSVMLADEPVASLDPANAQGVMDALKTICQEDQIPVLCNIHTLDIARAYSDRIIGMREGRIVFDGRPEDLSEAQANAIYEGSAPP